MSVVEEEVLGGDLVGEFTDALGDPASVVTNSAVLTERGRDFWGIALDPREPRGRRDRMRPVCCQDSTSARV